MNILVTGGCGYLGSVMVERLLNEGHHVRILDNMIFGKTELTHDTIVGDVTDSRSVSKALDGMDAVIHLAAIVGEGACNLNKELAVRINYMAVRNLAIMCEERGIKLIFPSTASVYGIKDTKEPLHEQSKLYPLSVYALTKLAAEDCIRTCCTNYVIFRLGTLHGISKRMRFDLVINRFVAMGVSKERITVFGGAQHRPFVHLHDACGFFNKALDHDKSGLFNLGGTNYRIIDVANSISSHLGAEVSVVPELKDPRDYAIESRLAVSTFKANFNKTVEDSIKEITPFAKVNNYKDARFNNEEWLREIW
jgi:nucleoside-diphosphate-sugar epimerase